MTEKEPVWCRINETNFFLDLTIDTNNANCLSQTEYFLFKIVLYFFLDPLEKIVIEPVLFLPDLFLKKKLKNFLILENFNKNNVCLKRCVGVFGLIFLIKILINKHYNSFNW